MSLSQDEIDNKVGKKKGRKNRPTITYDFKHPSRVSKDQTRTLENLHSNLARMMAASFSNLSRSIVDVDIAFVDQTTYAEFVMSLSNPSCSYTFTIEPLGGPAVLDFSLPVAFNMIDREFGGDGRFPPSKARPITAIERTVMTRVVTRTLADLEATWEALLRIQVTDAELETNPEFMQVAAPSDTVVLIAFEVNSQHASGLVNLCYPYFTLEPVMAYLNVQTWASRNRRRPMPDTPERRLEQLWNIDANTRVELGKGELSAEELMGIEVGDAIVLNTRANDPAVMYVEDEPLFLVRDGLTEDKHRHAVQVEDVIPMEERSRYGR
jgi:flagellar motor switch protein FliM